MMLFPSVFLLPLLIAGQASWDASLHLHDPATALLFNAYCLDGSRGGFYYRPASNPASSSKWKFHFQGGGWSGSLASSASRAQSLLGSSSTWTPTLSQYWLPEGAGFYGLMSANDSSVNPFGEWNFVWLAYCDGSSQTSDVAEPVEYNGTKLHFRGRALLDAHLYELERLYQFQSTATEVIISGTSAGGLSTWLHSSYIKSLLKTPGASLVAMPDAGFWWDHTAYDNPTFHPWLSMIEAAIVPTVWNSTLRGAPGKCLSTLAPQGLASHCYTLPYLYAFLDDVPIFVLQSMYDTANLGFCFNLNCNLVSGGCSPAQTAAIQEFHLEMMGNITAAQAQYGDRDGHFLTSCFQHEESCRAFDWYGVTIQEQTMNNTFYAWYTEGGASPNSKRIDGAFPSDATCVVGDHGAC